jgi:hypothetical protein
LLLSLAFLFVPEAAFLCLRMVSVRLVLDAILYLVIV